MSAAPVRDAGAIAYGFWDRSLTLDAIKAILADREHPDHIQVLAQLLREARADEVWRFVHPTDIVAQWPLLEPRLGRRRAFWAWLLQAWADRGFLHRPA